MNSSSEEEIVGLEMQLEAAGLSVFDEERYVFVVVLLLVFATSASLNGTVMIVFKWNRLIRTVNNSMVANLAVSDFFFVGLSCGMSVVSILRGDDWLHRRQFLCRFLGYCNHLFQSVSSYTCALISFHRFVSIVTPQRKLFGHPRCSRRFTIALWTCAMLTLLPSAMRQNAYQWNPVLATCTHFAYQSSDAVFSVYSVVINFVLPLSLMLFFYTRIYRTVLRHKMSIVNDISNTEVVERKSKRLMVAVLGIFFVTWMPYSFVLLFSACSAGTPPPNLVIYAVWLMSLLNTFFHPVLYAVCNRMFLRCIVRFLRCRGPIRNVAAKAVSPLSQRSCYAASNKIEEEEEEEEISTIAPLPGYECHFCPNCSRIGENYYVPALITNGTQTARFSVDQEPSEKILHDDAAQRPGCKFSTCSHCSLGSYSTRSSVPTVMRLPFRRYRRTASNSSQVSHFGCGPTPGDSGRSSFASQYVTTPGMCSARVSLASRTPASARTSTVSQYVQHSASDSATSSSFTDKSNRTQRSDKPGIQRLASDSSRQSIFSSYSALRSVRSSMSSRISHYLRMSHSTRSSVTSQCTSAYLPTPFSTRPNSPNAELEFLYMSGCSPRTTRQGSLFSRRSSSGTDSRYSSRISCLQIPESSLDIYEEDAEPPLPTLDDESPTSGDNSPKMSPCQSPGSNYDKMESRRSSSTCHRISVFLLGDFEPEDSTILIDDRNTDAPPGGIGREFWNSGGRKPGSTSAGTRKTIRRSRSGVSTPSPKQQSPRHFVTDLHAPFRLGGGSKSPVRCGGEASNSPHQAAIDSMNKAVGVVLSAKRLTARARSSVVFPFKPDTPVPELQPTIQIHRIPVKEPIHRIPVKEPIRFIYEGPIPANYYSFGVQKPMMSHLRVPGRPPNVPQTIIEEDQIPPPSPTESGRPETPSTRRRKNASSWIAPPIIDVMEVDDYRSKDMRVECPGVLVEHHS